MLSNFYSLLVVEIIIDTSSFPFVFCVFSTLIFGWPHIGESPLVICEGMYVCVWGGGILMFGLFFSIHNEFISRDLPPVRSPLERDSLWCFWLVDHVIGENAWSLPTQAALFLFCYYRYSGNSLWVLSFYYRYQLLHLPKSKRDSKLSYWFSYDMFQLSSE